MFSLLSGHLNLLLQFAPVSYLRQSFAQCHLLRHTLSTQRFVGLLQMPCDFRVDFVFLRVIKCETRESLPHEFNPIRHGPPW